MKKYFLLFSVVGLFLTSNINAQETNSEEFSKWSIDLNVTAFDFYSPENGNFSSFKENMGIGPDFSFTRHWSKSGLGLSVNILAPSISFTEDNSGNSNANKYLLFAGPGIAYNFQNEYLISAKSPVAPFVFANALASVAQIEELSGDVKFGFGIPVGAGLRFIVADKVGLNVKAGYAFGVTDYYESNIFWSAGATLGLNKSTKVEEEPELFIPVDTDGDGIYDEIDECPEVAGLPELNGCPDADGDGIVDKDDECPEVAGLAEFNGCPEPDTDGDGIVDSEDECPEVAGLANFNGCPEPDTDGDGVVDSKDECPEEAGSASNNGCPELIEIGSSVEFELGKAVLINDSHIILDKVVKIMSENPVYNVNVEGHTDNTGTDNINEKLSNDRAKVCADYIVSQGIDAERVSSVGFGSSQPVEENDTVEGRAKNRRTEFRLSFKD